MKRIFTCVAVVLATATAALAQTTDVPRTMTIDEGNVQWVYDVFASDPPMTFNGAQFTVEGRAYSLTDKTVITVAQGSATAKTVYVNYVDGGARVVAPGAFAHLLTVNVSGQNVDITANPLLADEITYVLSGTGESFALHGDYKSTIVLQGVSLAAKGAQPALWVDNGKRIDFVVSEGTKNTFVDAASNQKKSAFHVKGHAEWKGSGDVTVSGTSRHAYSSNEYTLFKPSFTGTFTVPAAGSDGMHIEQYLEIDGGTFNISGTKGDGIDVGQALEADGVTPTQDEKNGEYIQNGGTVTVVVDEVDTKGVKSEKTMTIKAGRINARANGDGGRAVQTGADLILGTEGADVSAAYLYLGANGATYKYTNENGEADSSKCRGLKVKGDFYFYPSTLDYEAGLKVLGSKLVDVDGIFYNRGGQKNASIIFSPGGGTQQ